LQKTRNYKNIRNGIVSVLAGMIIKFVLGSYLDTSLKRKTSKVWNI